MIMVFRTLLWAAGETELRLGLSSAQQLVAEIEDAVACCARVIVERNRILRQVGKIACTQVVAHGGTGAARIDVAAPRRLTASLRWTVRKSML